MLKSLSMPHAASSNAPARAITSLELFFDLVFAFAISQLSHHLLTHDSRRGAAETLVMLVGVFGVWSYTSFEVTLTNRRRPHLVSMMLGVMLLGLFMNAAIVHAFDDQPLSFVTPLLAIQIGRTLLSTIPGAPTPMLRRHYKIMLAWILASTPLWLAGAWADVEFRLVWWGGAALFDTIGTQLAHPMPGGKLSSENVPFDAEHMIERLRLFLIIALGEVVLTTGAAISEARPGPSTWFAGACALAIIVSLWSLYFRSTDDLVSRHTDETSNPILAARLAMNGQFVVVGALISIAVAIEKVIAHPHGLADIADVGLLFGGAATYLLVQSWYLKFVTGRLHRLRLAGVAVLVLALLALGAAHAASLLILAVAAVMMTTLAVATAAGTRAALGSVS
jgi:low temperature requirement protein LtrA